MSRSGYTDDNDDPLAIGRWRARVVSAIRGRRGQEFLKELAREMDAMPVKELIAGELIDEEGDCCTIGVVCKARGIDVSKIDPHEADEVGAAVGIASQLAAEIEYWNDEVGDRYEQRSDDRRWERISETPAERWKRMREWVESKIKR